MRRARTKGTMAASDRVPAVLAAKRKLKPHVKAAQRTFGPTRRFRLATRKMRLLPAFLVIGAQRAGTTALFDYLLRHPDIAGPLPGGGEVAWSRKELRFFDARYTKGTDWYRSFFPLERRREAARRRGGDLLVGEATPYYMFHPVVPARAAETIPDAKLIALVRDPVARAYSHYQLARRLGQEPLETFEEALAAERERLAGEEERLLAGPVDLRSPPHRKFAYFARGLYADQLERWLEHYPREQLLVLVAEEFFVDPAAAFAQTLDFLGARTIGLSELTDEITTAAANNVRAKQKTVRNRAAYEPLEPETRAELEKRYAEPNARLAGLLRRELPWGPTTGADGDRAEGSVAPSANVSRASD